MALRVHSLRIKTLLATVLALGVSPALLIAGEAPAQLPNLPITNSILTSFLITTLLIIGIRLMVGTPKIIPTRGQAVFETLVDAMREMFEPIVGKKAMPTAFPLLLCFFVFILVHNWSGLLPFIGTAGWGYTDPETGKFILQSPLLRPHTSEANGTIALALVSFGAWIILIFKYAGPKLIWQDLFGNKSDKRELHPVMYQFLTLVFLAVGLIEIISIFIRPVTLAARLFGNIYGGEELLHATGFIFVFYFLEIIVGLVQAFVFTLLSAVYIGLICNHGDDHHGDHGHGHAESKEAAH